MHKMDTYHQIKYPCGNSPDEAAFSLRCGVFHVVKAGVGVLNVPSQFWPLVKTSWQTGGKNGSLDWKGVPGKDWSTGVHFGSLRKFCPIHCSSSFINDLQHDWTLPKNLTPFTCDSNEGETFLFWRTANMKLHSGSDNGCRLFRWQRRLEMRFVWILPSNKGL